MISIISTGVGTTWKTDRKTQEKMDDGHEGEERGKVGGCGTRDLYRSERVMGLR